MSNTGFSQGFGDVRAIARAGLVGDYARVSHLNTFLTGINSVPQAAQVTTVTVTGAVDSTDYTLSINNVSITVNSGTGATTTSIATLIAAAVNAEPLVRASVIATSAAAVVTLTGKIPGESFTVTESDANLGAPVTVPAVGAEAVPFGRAVVFTGYSEAGAPDQLVGLAKSVRFTPQVQTLTVDTGAAVDMSVTVYELRGTERVLVGTDTVTGNATAATQATTIRDAINAIAGSVVTASGAAAEVIVTADLAGFEFEVVVDEAGVSSVNTTGPSQATSFNRAWVGTSLYSPNDESAIIGGANGQYAANAGIRFNVKGMQWVENTAAVSDGDTVYVELADGDDSGKFFPASSATRVALSRQSAEWRYNAVPSTDGLGIVRFDSGRAP